MHKRFRHIILLLFTLLHTAHGQNTAYQLFENIGQDTEASAVSCFLQDDEGMMWIGSSRGLYSYDGYSTQVHFEFDRRSNSRIYCGVKASNSRLYLGADAGLLIYNYRTDRYDTTEGTPLHPLTDVRALALQGEQLWIGTLSGLYVWNLRTKTLKTFDRKQYPTLPHATIYSIIRSHDDRIYIGTYNGLCYYQPTSDSFRSITLPHNLQKSNLLVNSLLEDTVRRCIWIGTEGNLLKYTPADERILLVDGFHDNSIKSLAIDRNGHLLAGTDNGLYVYQGSEKEPQHVMHDSRNPQSLSNNIVWSIFADREQNIWLGTDNGVSLARNNSAYRYVPISQITGTGDGNQFYSLFKDSRGYYWFGGTNGLIRFQNVAVDRPDALWYKMSDRHYPLSHSRIRHIYEDKDRQLWIATDGSVNQYDYTRRQFTHYSIIDSTGTYNANWAYHLLEDDRDKLWIATCLGGVFVADKQQLMQCTTGNYVAEYNFNTRNGLSGMFVNQLAPDREGNVWVLLYNNGIDKIDIRTRKITPFDVNMYTDGRQPNFILCDREGFIWCGFRGGVMRITPKDGTVRTLRFDAFNNNEILSMMEAGGHIWISTADGFWVVDKQTQEARRLNLADKRFTCMFFDSEQRTIYLGGVDGFAITSPDVLSGNTDRRPILLTALYVNNQLLVLPGQSIRYTTEIELNYRQSNLSIELSDLPYSQEEKSKFVYRLEGIDRDWNLLTTNTNRISYTNLAYGDYRLNISKLDSHGHPSADMHVLAIRINPPWYYTFWAKSIYLLLLVSLVAWTINFFRVKSRLKNERIEKEKILEQSRQKIDFFTNLSHELKTPLSLIVAPVSKLLHEVRNPQEKKQLELVQRNAMQLNSLIHQVLDFNRVDSDTSAMLILSHTELVGFARHIFTMYEEAGREKGIAYRFQSQVEKWYADIDIIKWESILNNLLSNATKYTPQGGSIELSLEYREDARTLEISVSDTGTGIPKQDLPYIFQRFFQSSQTAGRKEGTGIGLYLVKTYTELHGGSIRVTSEENRGTTIVLSLPFVREEVLATTPEASEERVSEVENPSTDTHPLILVVDDNPEISGFIVDIFHTRYRCLTADNGKTGLDLCLEHHPDLVIADVMMPIMDGMEMCRHIRKNVPTSTTPIILLTAKSDKDTELESMHYNVDAFISKPFEPDILISRVEQLIQAKQTLEAKTRMEVIATPTAIEATSQDEKFLAAITRLIEERISDSDLNVNALCDLSGINNKQIYRKLKQLTGMTPVEYIKSIRMKKAAMLLNQNTFTVAEVMYMVGYSNHSYFSKCFQAEFGVTPKQWMQQ